MIASHVAEFETPQQQPQAVPPHNPSHPSVQAHAAHHPHAPSHHAYPPHAMHAQYYPYPHPAPPPPPGPQIKTEPVDPRFVLSGPPPPPPPSYSVQSLPGPQIPPQPPRPGGQVISFPAPPAPTARYQSQPVKNGATNGRIPQADGPSTAGPSRIPQVDGPSSSSESGSPSPPPPASYAPRGAAHPSLPQPMQSRADHDDDDEAINSDLDDSDSEGERDDPVSGAESDIVFCTYDKVWLLCADRAFVLNMIGSRWRVSRTNGSVSSRTA